MEMQPNQNSNAPTVVSGPWGQSAVADYQSAVTATTYHISDDANAPKYVILSSVDK